MDDAVFRVPLGQALFGAIVARSESVWLWLDRLETDLFLERIRETKIDRPVYVSGLARSGSTILLEFLASLDDVATHRYRDYPPLYVPLLWSRLLDVLPKKAANPTERTHLDGIAITPDSPEAFEEVFWMRFFPRQHDPQTDNLLDEHTENSAFESFYRNHIRKLIVARKARRYVAKGNYNLGRLAYLRKIFPTARFVVPVRRPDGHIASLMKQHALFCRGEKRHPAMLEHLRRVGHFEFGLDRRPINPGDVRGVRDILDLWAAGEELRGWARYWALVHRHLADQLDRRPDLSEASLVVRFEDLCAEPAATLRRILAHTELEAPAGTVERFAERIRYPAYYKPAFSESDLATIDAECGPIARRFGYDSL